MVLVIVLLGVLVLTAVVGVVLWSARQSDEPGPGPAGDNPYGDDRWTGSGGTAGSDWGPGP